MIKIEENMNSKEKVNIGLVILSVLIPLAGIIIYISQKNKQPKTAVISIICSVINFVILTICIQIIMALTIKISDTKILENVAKNKEFNRLYSAKDTISIAMADALSDYYDEIYMQNSTSKASLTKHVKSALKKAKKELNEDEIELKASGNTIYLSTDTKKISGTIGKEGSIEWSEIEDK